MKSVLSSNLVPYIIPLEKGDDYLNRIGNLDDLKDQYGLPYQFIRRSVKAVGVLLHDDLALKLYHMVRENVTLPQNLVEGLEDFLIAEIEAERISSKQGIGFAILSQGFLSINIWGRGNVLFTQTYTVEANPPHLSREPLEKTGVACTWEAKIMHHEYGLWHDYITSSVTLDDKRRYLQTFIDGNL